MNAVPDENFLEPLARADRRFQARDPEMLKRMAFIAGDSLRCIHLPIYDSSMKDEHWNVMDVVMEHCTKVHTLSFVDSTLHDSTTPEDRKLNILRGLLPRLKDLRIFLLLDSEKLYTMARCPFFAPKQLSFHQLQSRMQQPLLDMLVSRGSSLQSLTLSFEDTDHQNSLYPLQETFDYYNFLTELARVVNQHLIQLTELHLLRRPRNNPLYALDGPDNEPEQSKRDFVSVSTALREIKDTSTMHRPFRHLTVERTTPTLDLACALRLFSSCVDETTEIEVFLHEVLLVSPVKPANAPTPLPFFRATALHSTSWMFELPDSYFRRTEHIRVCSDEDMSAGPRDQTLLRRFFPQDGMVSNPDMKSFKFLCEKARGHVQTVVVKMAIDSTQKANTVLRTLSQGFGYAKAVRTLEISADLLRYIGTQPGSLYSVTGQLKELEELCVCQPAFVHDRSSAIEHLPVLLDALWDNCRKLEIFKFEFGYGIVNGEVGDVIAALQKFEKNLPGVETCGLGELLDLRRVAHTRM